MLQFLTRDDLLLTPVLARPPIKLGELDQSQSADKIIAWLQDYCPITPLANATGQPAMSVPLFWNAEAYRPSAATSSPATATRQRYCDWRRNSRKPDRGPGCWPTTNAVGGSATPAAS